MFRSYDHLHVETLNLNLIKYVLGGVGFGNYTNKIENTSWNILKGPVPPMHQAAIPPTIMRSGDRQRRVLSEEVA
jgi:hypothetical protein